MLKLTLTFTEEDLNSILKSASLGNDNHWTVESLKKAKLYQAFVKEMKDTADSFVGEIVDGSYEACANDWLSIFGDGPNE